MTMRAQSQADVCGNAGDGECQTVRLGGIESSTTRDFSLAWTRSASSSGMVRPSHNSSRAACLVARRQAAAASSVGGTQAGREVVV